jgi:carbamate kinase
VALGGNAILRRGEPLTAQNQRRNVRVACEALAPVAMAHELVISHGNGPQVGLLALQAAAYAEVDPYPLDVLGAQTEGMLGYVIEQELGNLLPVQRHLATILTMVEVSPHDPAFADPTKFVGPVYTRAEAEELAARKGWTVKPDGPHWRRVVPSPLPLRIFEMEAIRLLVDWGAVVICTGGGGIPTMFAPDGQTLIGAEAVIDKDLASAVLAADLGADLMVLATDAQALFHGWGTPEQRAIRTIHPDVLAAMAFAPGSMAPKVAAAVDFANRCPGTAVIGSLERINDIVAGKSGTRVSATADLVVDYW